MNDDAGVLVLGGGPAGCAAAITLARSGLRVTLLERTKRAEPKVCGEFVSVEACEAARELGVDLEALGAATIDRVRIVSQGAVVESRLPFRARSVSRAAFDEALLAASREAGVRVERGAHVLGVSGGSVRIRYDERIDVRRGRAIVLATGKSDLLGVRRGGTRPAGSIGLKMHLRLDDAELADLATAVELTLVAGGYAGMQRIEDGRVAFAAAVDRATYTACGGWRGLVDRMTRANVRLHRRLQCASDLWPKPLAVSGVPYGFVYRDSIAASREIVPYRVGDQLAVIPSFTGDGIAIALLSGWAAATAIGRGESPAQFHAAFRRRLRVPMLVAGGLSTAIRSPFGRAAIVYPARVVPHIISTIATLTRLTANRRP